MEQAIPTQRTTTNNNSIDGSSNIETSTVSNLLGGTITLASKTLSQDAPGLQALLANTPSADNPCLQVNIGNNDLIGTSNYHLFIKETLQVSLFCLVDIILDLFLVCGDPFFFADTTVAPPSEEFHG